jgi:CBS domain-containing protein
MRIADILRHKGTDVVTVLPEDSVSEVLDKLAERNIGAVLVCSAEREVAGVLSERDVVRELHARGAEILNARAGQVMSSPVISCRSDDSVDSVAATMTDACAGSCRSVTSS